MAITVGELKDYLEEYDDDVEVRLAQQPQWSFEYSIDGNNPVVADDPYIDFYSWLEEEWGGDYEDFQELPEEDKSTIRDDYTDWMDSREEAKVIYIVEGRQLGYLGGRIKELCGWS